MRTILTLAGVLYLSTLTLAVSGQTPATAPAAGRFDMEVRADFFAGFAGDATRFARAMARCEEALTANPDHAEALVWHGSGVLNEAAQAFANQDFAKGNELWQKGLAEMNRAVS